MALSCGSPISAITAEDAGASGRANERRPAEEAIKTSVVRSRLLRTSLHPDALRHDFVCHELQAALRAQALKGESHVSLASAQQCLPKAVGKVVDDRPSVAKHCLPRLRTGCFEASKINNPSLWEPFTGHTGENVPKLRPEHTAQVSRRADGVGHIKSVCPVVIRRRLHDPNSRPLKPSRTG